MRVFFFVLMMVPSALLGQQTPVDLSGSWQADMMEGQDRIVVNGDSTVTFGEETVSIRISADTIFVQFGEEWVAYNFVLDGEALTLSGGDLMDPVTLRRVGPPSNGEPRSWLREVRDRGASR